MNTVRISEKFLTVPCNGRIMLLRPETIQWVEADRNCIKLHVGEGTVVMKSTLDRLQDELDNRTFVRIHRSTIVNLNHIRELRHWMRGSYRVILEDGTQLLLSRNHRDHLFNAIGMPIV